MRLVAVGHGNWLGEPGIWRPRLETVMCGTRVSSTPCMWCVGGSAIEPTWVLDSCPECALRIATLAFKAAQMLAQSA